MARPITSLRRLSAALVNRTGARVQTTDWWAVLVEVAVVVLGIVIAFELSEWDQRRQERREEVVLLRHLSEETAADIAAIRLVRDEHLESAANYALLVTAVRSRAAADAYNRRGSSGCNLLRLPAVRYHSLTGLEAGDRAELIRDTELRHLIRRADAERAFNDRQLDYFRDSFHRYSAIIEPHMEWRLSRSGVASCSVDVAGLAGDDEAVALLDKAGRDQRRFAEYRNRELASAEAVSRRASCVRRGNCAGR